MNRRTDTAVTGPVVDLNHDGFSPSFPEERTRYPFWTLSLAEEFTPKTRASETFMLPSNGVT
jgi:hypothetical protein